MIILVSFVELFRINQVRLFWILKSPAMLWGSLNDSIVLVLFAFYLLFTAPSPLYFLEQMQEGKGGIVSHQRFRGTTPPKSYSNWLSLLGRKKSNFTLFFLQPFQMIANTQTREGLLHWSPKFYNRVFYSFAYIFGTYLIEFLLVGS